MYDYLEGKEFIKTGEFKVGDISINVFAYNKLVTLFDPIEFINKVDEYIIETQYKSRKRYLYKEVDPKFIYKVRVKFDNNDTKEKVLVTEEGIYQLIFKVDCEECIKMRRSFAHILSAYRRRHGWTLQRFLELSYCERNYITVNSTHDRRAESKGIEYLILRSASYDNLTVLRYFEAPYFEGFLIEDEKIDYYIENIDKVNIINKCVYCLREDKVFETLSNILGYTEVYILSDVLKDISVIYIDGKNIMHLDADEIYSKLISFFGNKEEAAKVYEELLFQIFRDKDVVKILYRSTVDFHDLQKNLPITYAYAYKQKLKENLEYYHTEVAVQKAKEYVMELRKHRK